MERMVTEITRLRDALRVARNPSSKQAYLDAVRTIREMGNKYGTINPLEIERLLR